MPSAVTQNVAVVAASHSPTQLSQLSTQAQREAATVNAGTQAVQAVQRVTKLASSNLTAKEQQQSTTPNEEAVDGSFRSAAEEPAARFRSDGTVESGPFGKPRTLRVA